MHATSRDGPWNWRYTLPQLSVSHGLEQCWLQKPWKLCVNGRATISLGLGIVHRRSVAKLSLTLCEELCRKELHPSLHLPVLKHLWWITARKRNIFIVFGSLHCLLKSLCFSSLECSDYIHRIKKNIAVWEDSSLSLEQRIWRKICQDNSLYSVSQAHIMDKELLVQTHDFSINKNFVGPWSIWCVSSYTQNSLPDITLCLPYFFANWSIFPLLQHILMDIYLQVIWNEIFIWYDTVMCDFAQLFNQILI